MDEEKDIIQSQSIQITSERLTRVEVRVEGISVAQQKLENIVSSQATLLAELTARTIINEQTVKALIDGNEQHKEDIKSLTENQVNTGQLLTEFKTGLNQVRGAIGAIALFITTYVLTHFLK